jgi:hypothetical protein
MQFSFDQIVIKLEQYLSLLSNWGSVLYFGTWQRLIDMVAYITEKMVYITEFYYNESNWSTATRIESMVNKSKQIAYIPHRAIGATGPLTLSADSTFSSSYVYSGNSVIIPKWEQFTDTTGTLNVFNTAQTIYYNNTTGNITLNVSEGAVKIFTYTALGTANEIIQLFSSSIDQNYIQVDIVDANNNVLYPVSICGVNGISDELFFINDINNYYCKINNSPDFQSILITNGDGIKTKKLNGGDLVRITYTETQGFAGDITALNTIVKIETPLKDGYGNIVNLYVTNSQEISNGNDIETIKSIRANGPNAWVAGYRAGSPNDWKTLLELHPYIHKAKIWSNDDLGVLANVTDVNKIFVTAIASDGSALTTLQQGNVALYMKELKSPTELIGWEDLNIITLFFKMDATVTNTAFGQISGQIYDSLNSKYGILNTDFQTNVYYSNYIATVNDLDTIKHCTIQGLYLEKDFAEIVTNYPIAPSYTSGSTSTKADQIYLTPKTFEIWIKRKISNVWQAPIRIGRDVSGVIISDNGYTITSQAISYVTNNVSFTVQDIVLNPYIFGIQNPSTTDPNGYIISIAYQTQDGYGLSIGDIKLPAKQFITTMDPDYVQISMNYA